MRWYCCFLLMLACRRASTSASVSQPQVSESQPHSVTQRCVTREKFKMSNLWRLWNEDEGGETEILLIQVMWADCGVYKLLEMKSWKLPAKFYFSSIVFRTYVFKMLIFRGKRQKKVRRENVFQMENRKKLLSWSAIITAMARSGKRCWCLQSSGWWRLVYQGTWCICI